VTGARCSGRDHLQRVMPQRARCFHDGLVSEHYDVIIVGSGAGGGTLAHTLAPSGKRILLLERGDSLPREMDNWDPKPGRMS
jgi:NADPH-dependent 2,4-dienoyl-CoA reductase/sulfur reductase-like enzyme